MKYVITDNNDVIIDLSETIGYQENGNVLINNGTLAIAASLVKEVYEVNNIPENIEAQKYCYTTKDGFYENPDYVEPPKTIEERVGLAEDTITEIELALTEIYEGGLV